MDRLPLFPLGVVLFPGMPLALRVFEPRYHTMLQDCAASGRSFGVVLLREGREVGGDAEPFGVGTEARVEQRADADGVAFLRTRGARRFRIARTFHDKSYLEGEVAWLPDPPEEASPIEREVATLFEEYAGLVGQLARGPDEELKALLRVPAGASAWTLACAVGAALLVPAHEKQPILETASARGALLREKSLLLRENARLRVLARSTAAHLN